jgi:putative transposase
LTNSYSNIINLPLQIRGDFFNKLDNNKDLLVDIIAYCLMPNHFHFLLRQRTENGISKFIANLSNSYTRFYNIKHKRTGPIFQGKFKAVEVLSDEQIIHLSRYIHLNPFSAGIVTSIQDLLQYPYSSLPEYLNGQKEICKICIVMGQFEDKICYRKFVTDQADYQRSMQIVKKQIIES